MKRAIKLLAWAKQLYINDSLFRNAALLMASTAIMSVLGFLFWIFVAHLYSPATIGEASALISITTLISNVSLLGLNAGLVRFLPKSKSQSRDINAALLTVGIVTIVAAVVYLVVSELFGVHFSLLSTPWHKIAFAVLMATVSLNTLTDAVFIANRKAEFHTLGYTTFGVVKLILPLFLIPFGSLGIFLAYILAVIASLVLSLFFMKRFCGYEAGARPNWNVLKKTKKYAANNYIGVILAGLPSQLMPLFIIKDLGAPQAAYFAMAWTMANLLYVIPSAAAQSLLAESSHDGSQKSRNLKHTVRLLSIILVPGVLLTVFIAPYILQIFGQQYSSGSTVIFQLLALSTLFIAINTVCISILNIERRTTGIVAAQIVALGVTFGAAIPLMKYGLTGVGIAMLLGMAATSICFYFVFLYNRHHRLPDTESLDTPLANDELYVASQENIAPVLAAYGISHFAFKQLHNGSSSYTFLVRADAKLKVLRIYKKDKKTDHQIEQELAFMHFLAEHGIPVPRVIENIHNNTLASTKIGSTSWQHVLMDYEPGKHPRKYTSAILFRMAQIQAQIHIHGIAYAKDKHQSRTDIKQLKSADDHNKGMLSFLHLAPKGFSHFDFDASNILIDDKQITCVLDFEGMHYGPLVTCIYFTLTRIYDLQPQADDIRLYLTSYQHIRSLNMFEKAILGFALALHYRSPRLLFVHSR